MNGNRKFHKHALVEVWQVLSFFQLDNTTRPPFMGDSSRIWIENSFLQENLDELQLMLCRFELGLEELMRKKFGGQVRATKSLVENGLWSCGEGELCKQLLWLASWDFGPSNVERATGGCSIEHAHLRRLASKHRWMKHSTCNSTARSAQWTRTPGLISNGLQKQQVAGERNSQGEPLSEHPHTSLLPIHTRS